METIKKRLLDAKEAAMYLSISRANLYQWIERGKIKSLKLGGRRLFDILELNDFIESLKNNRAI
jgi:excisionase family DNA binding protein